MSRARTACCAAQYYREHHSFTLRSRKRVSLDSDLYMCLVFSAVLRLDCDTFDNAAAWLPCILLNASGFAFTGHGVPTVKDKIGGESPQILHGAAF